MSRSTRFDRSSKNTRLGSRSSSAHARPIGSTHEAISTSQSSSKHSEPGGDGYSEAFFGLGADVSEALRTDDVDLLDVHALSASLARSVFDEGVLLMGESERVAALRRRLAENGTVRDERPPCERFDDSLRRIDDHFA